MHSNVIVSIWEKLGATEFAFFFGEYHFFFKSKKHTFTKGILVLYRQLQLLWTNAFEFNQFHNKLCGFYFDTKVLNWAYISNECVSNIS